MKVKCKSSGLNEKFKAHLVAKDYTLRGRIGYDETLILVVRFFSISLTLEIIDYSDLELFKMNVRRNFSMESCMKRSTKNKRWTLESKEMSIKCVI